MNNLSDLYWRLKHQICIIWHGRIERVREVTHFVTHSPWHVSPGSLSSYSFQVLPHPDKPSRPSNIRFILPVCRTSVLYGNHIVPHRASHSVCNSINNASVVHKNSKACSIYNMWVILDNLGAWCVPFVVANNRSCMLVYALWSNGLGSAWRTWSHGDPTDGR